MKALLKTKKGKGYLGIKDVPIPEINDNEVLIKVHYSGICGTDIHIFSDQFPIYYPPVILGHEFSGEIVKIVEKIDYWKIGNRVVVEFQNNIPYKEETLSEATAVSPQVLYTRAKAENADFVVVLGSGLIGFIIAKMTQITSHNKYQLLV